MKTKAKTTFFMILCIGLLTCGVFGQTTTADEINREKQRIIESKKKIIELKKKQADEEIQKEEQELRQLQAEIDGKTTSGNGTVSQPVLPPELNPNPTPSGGPKIGVTIVQPVLLGSPLTNKPSVAPTNPQNNSPTTSAAPPPAAQTVNCLTVALDPASTSKLDFAICRLANSMIQNGANEINAGTNQYDLADFVASKLAKSEADKSFFQQSERKRTDKQVGSGPGSSGTTSLVVKGGMPTIIGWAVEQGAATSAVSGNTVTVRVNPLNLGKALFYNQGVIDLKLAERNPNPFDSFLKKVSLGFSFDMTRGNASPIFIGSKQQLSAYSVRYEFLNRRNPFSARHAVARNAFWNSQTANLDPIAAGVRALVDTTGGNVTITDPALKKWVDDTNTELSKIDSNLSGTPLHQRIEAIIREQLTKFPAEEIGKNEKLVAAMTTYTQGRRGFKTTRDAFIEKINQGTVVAFEYTNSREVDAPDTSNFRFIWEKGVLKFADLTVNASLTVFNKKPVAMGTKRIKDFDFSAQLDMPLKMLPGNNFLSFAGRYVRQPGDIVLPNGVVANGSKGDIALGQIKLTIPLWDSGIRLPFSVTFANRTDLIKESRIKGNFGFTLDLDQIFKPFMQFGDFVH